MEQCILFGCFEREFDTPKLFDTREDARAAMKKAIIDAMNGLDESIFEDYEKETDYDWSPDADSAWFNNRRGNSDWEIYTLDEILNPSAETECGTATNENSELPKQHTLHVAFAIQITPEDIDDIMCAAFEGGITYWCSKAEPVEGLLGTYAHEQISRGGKLVLHDSEGGERHKLTQEKFLKGLRLFLARHSDVVSLDEKRIDSGDFDAEYADAVIQLALFGKIVYS